jgi:hypothetical protein
MDPAHAPWGRLNDYSHQVKRSYLELADMAADPQS